MIEKSFSRLSAVQLRMILFVSLGAIILLGATGFYFIQQHLRNFAVEVSHASEDARTSDNDIAALKKLQKQLAENQDNIKRTQSIVADSKSYKYQDQIIKDLNTYASRSGIGITRFTFDDAAAGPGAKTTPTAGAAAPATISGLKSTSVSIGLKTPTQYKNLMNFVHAIEQNLTKMQIAGLSLNKGDNPTEVSISALTIEVYIQ